MKLPEVGGFTRLPQRVADAFLPENDWRNEEAKNAIRTGLAGIGVIGGSVWAINTLATAVQPLSPELAAGVISVGGSVTIDESVILGLLLYYHLTLAHRP